MHNIHKRTWKGLFCIASTVTNIFQSNLSQKYDSYAEIINQYCYYLHIFVRNQYNYSHCYVSAISIKSENFYRDGFRSGNERTRDELARYGKALSDKIEEVEEDLYNSVLAKVLSSLSTLTA